MTAYKFSEFQSTLPAGGATAKSTGYCLDHVFQSTLPAGGATSMIMYTTMINAISIHAPRGGSDAVVQNREHVGDDFNPRSPRGERR